MLLRLSWLGHNTECQHPPGMAQPHEGHHHLAILGKAPLTLVGGKCPLAVFLIVWRHRLCFPLAYKKKVWELLSQTLLPSLIHCHLPAAFNQCSSVPVLVWVDIYSRLLWGTVSNACLKFRGAALLCSLILYLRQRSCSLYNPVRWNLDPIKVSSETPFEFSEARISLRTDPQFNHPGWCWNEPGWRPLKTSHRVMVWLNVIPNVSGQACSQGSFLQPLRTAHTDSMVVYLSYSCYWCCYFTAGVAKLA